MTPDLRIATAFVLPLVYGELRKLGRSLMAKTPPGNTLQPTALVHEAYLKLADSTPADLANRRQFYALASKAMRSILIDNARWHARQKRGGGRCRARRYRL